MNVVKNDTPWLHVGFSDFPGLFNGQIIHIKREELCCPFPGPMFSKIRGLEKRIQTLKNGLLVPDCLGVVDTVHSKAGWGVSYLAQLYGMKAVVYYPYLKSEGIDFIRDYQMKCRDDFAAVLRPIPATMSAVLFNIAKKQFREEFPEGYLLPNGLKLPESVEGTCEEVLRTPKDFLKKDIDWIISVSSGTIAAGVARGLTKLDYRGKLILHLGYKRSHAQVLGYIRKFTEKQERFAITIIDEEYQYKDKVDWDCPVACNPYYDLKAWKWMMGKNKNRYSKESVFWNIGA